MSKIAKVIQYLWLTAAGLAIALGAGPFVGAICALAAITMMVVSRAASAPGDAANNIE